MQPLLGNDIPGIKNLQGWTLGGWNICRQLRVWQQMIGRRDSNSMWRDVISKKLANLLLRIATIEDKTVYAVEIIAFCPTGQQTPQSGLGPAAVKQVNEGDDGTV